MEEKRRDAGNLAPANSAGSPASEPNSSRRRGGAQKRKSSNFSSSNSSSTPSKRLTREKAAISYPPLAHNGPLTRARQGPTNLASASGSAAVKIEESAGAPVGSAHETISPADKALQERAALEAKIEAQFEAIKSRDENVHVVPAHCGWFSWTEIHSIEEHSLPSFFNKKSENRNPDVYKEIRDFIMRKFHANPKVQIELKDLSELEVGDVEARQEVMDFLSYWGLINYNPVLPSDTHGQDINADTAVKDDSLLEKLYSFENLQSHACSVPNNNLLAPAVPSGLFPESATTEELTRPEGPAVEYHCNSCSADCSRKRYHCQKQADFDLCSDCFNNGKFGSSMSSSDFILMEPAEVPGVGGGNWTDQETLLLLEALELYKHNWNEIAEHVATKTKAQCMLHFVQMPIEDVFLDCDDGDATGGKESKSSALSNNDSPVLKETSDAADNEGQLTTSETENSKPEGAGEGKNSQETPKEDNASEAKTEISKEKDTSTVKVEEKSGENIALKALREAFDDIGYPLTPEGHHSFAEAGNPVMAVAAFLARLVGPDLASASARCSLKSLSTGSGMQLAARHCFCLEDPPAEKKEPVGSESITGKIVDQDSQIDENQKKEVDKDGNSTTISNGKDLSNDHSNGNVGDLPLKEKEQSNSSNGDSRERVQTARESCRAASSEEPQTVCANESNLESAEDHTPQIKKSNVVVTKPKLSEASVIDSGGNNSAATGSQSSHATTDVDANHGSPSTEMNKSQQPTPNSIVQASQSADTSKDVDGISDQKDPEKAQAPPHSEGNEPEKQVTSSSVVENGPSSGDCQTKDDKIEKIMEKKDDNNTTKLKHAAVSAIAAAAVKAKLLADQEEEQIRQLASSLVEKQLCKLETKLAFFNEMENVTARIKEQLERSRQRLYHERAQIIASRFASSSRGHPSLPNRIATNLANSVPRPPTMGMNMLRPPISRPMGMMGPPASNTLASAGNGMPSGTVQSSGQEKISSVGTKSP